MCVEEYSINFEKLENRLKSFKNWKEFTEPFEIALDEHLRFPQNCHFALSMKKFEEKLEQEISYKLFYNICILVFLYIC